MVLHRLSSADGRLRASESSGQTGSGKARKRTTEYILINEE